MNCTINRASVNSTAREPYEYRLAQSPPLCAPLVTAQAFSKAWVG
jgi:hypothetical protein